MIRDVVISDGELVVTRLKSLNGWRLTTSRIIRQKQDKKIGALINGRS